METIMEPSMEATPVEATAMETTTMETTALEATAAATGIRRRHRHRTQAGGEA
jgi:hypothetical protein